MTRKRQPPKAPAEPIEPAEPAEPAASTELEAPVEAEPLVEQAPAEPVDAPLEVVLPEDLLSSDDGRGDALPLADDDEGPGLEKAPPVATGASHLKAVVEALIFASDKPVTVGELAKAANAKAPELKPLLSDLVEEYRGRGVELVEVSGGYQFRTSALAAPFVRDYVAAKPVRLTRAQVETLSIVAYRQPVTRPEIDDIRGVDSGSSLKILLDRGLLKILGKKEEAGRPLIYGTTPQFLEFFGLGSLRDLPTLREFSELSDESKALFERRSGEPLGDIGVSSAEIDGETGAERQAVDLEASQAVEQVERGDFDEEGAAEADGADADADAEADGADADAGADSNSDADSDADAAESSPQPSPSTGEGAGDADDDDADSEDAKDDDLGDDDDDDDEDDDDEDDDDEDDDDEDDEP